jgi:hypothetical protein
MQGSKNRSVNMSRPEAKSAFGPRFSYLEAKTGGVNRPGKEGGVYAHLGPDGKPTGKRSLFKQDTKGEKVRIAKVLGEAIGGKILAAWFKIVGVPKERFAEAKLAKVEGFEEDKSGQNLYLQSVFIDNYKEDFWKHAYRQYYLEEYRAIVNSHNADEIAQLRSLATSNLSAELLKLNEEKKDEAFLSKAADLEARINNKIESYRQDDEALIADAAEITVSRMKRPSAVFIKPGYAEVRRIISKAITANKTTLVEFAQITAARLLVGDFGVHNGNFGVLKDGTLVCLDYGAAFCKLNPEVNPFTKTKTGTKFYKNHFLEYSDGVIKSPEMAMEFILIGRMSKDQINRLTKESIDELQEFADLEALKKFAFRLGMKSRTVRTMDTEESAATKIQTFMAERLLNRQRSMKNQGFALLLETCYINGEFNTLKFENILNEGKLNTEEVNELYDFVNQRAFRKMKLVIHESHQFSIKKKISAAVNEHRIFSEEQASQYNYCVLEIRNQLNYRLENHLDHDQSLTDTLKKFQEIMSRDNAFILQKKTSPEYRDLLQLILRYERAHSALPIQPPLARAQTLPNPLARQSVPPIPAPRPAPRPSSAPPFVRPNKPTQKENGPDRPGEADTSGEKETPPK